MGRGQGNERNGNLFYEPVPKRTSRHWQVGSPPWEAQEYLDRFVELPERALYFEVDDPQELKLILDGPRWQRKTSRCTQQARMHIGVNIDSGFSIHLYSTTNGQSALGGMRQGRSSGADLVSALDYCNQEIARVAQEIADREQVTLVAGSLQPFTLQDFHDAYLGLANNTLDNPPPLAPLVNRQRQFEPREWLGRVSAGKDLHLRVEPGVWYRLGVSGWGEQGMGVSIIGLVLSDPDAVSHERQQELAKGFGEYFKFPEEDIVKLYEYPQSPGAEQEVDPRNLAPALGENKRVNTVPNVSYAEMNALLAIG